MSFAQPVRPSSVSFIIAFAVSAMPLGAAVTTYTSANINSATSVSFDPAPDAVTNYAGPSQLSDAGAHNLAFSNNVNGATVKPVTDDVFALASLSAGQLKARSILSYGNNVSVTGNPLTLGIRNGSASATAIMADSFSARTAATNSPFIWTAGNTATFHFAVTGTNSFPPGLPDPVDFSAGQPLNQVYASLQFTAYRPGGLDVLDQLNHFDFSRPFSEYLALNNQLTALTIAGGGKFWYLGNGVAPFDIDPAMVLPVDPTTPVDATVSFHPNGDFEWTLNLSTTIQLDAAQQNLTATLDFSHTISSTYVGPEGTTTLSASGVFPDTLPLPEPSLLAPLAACLPVLSRRRRA